MPSPVSNASAHHSHQQEKRRPPTRISPLPPPAPRIMKQYMLEMPRSVL